MLKIILGMRNEPIEDYIEEHISAEPEALRRLDRCSHLTMVHPHMCSGHTQGRLLKMLTTMVRPRRVLELGTYSGYATLCMAEAMLEIYSDGQAAIAADYASGDISCPRIDTVEVFDELEGRLRSLFAEAPGGRLIDLHIGDALDFMASAEPLSYDLIFIDADKRRYPEYLEAALPLLRRGGYIIADNTLWDGHVADPQRHDPLTVGIRRFNDAVAVNPRLEKVIIPMRDGLSLIRKL